MLGLGISIGIDHFMAFGFGFLLCGVLALIPIPYVHNRAVRLTEQKLDAASPISMHDIQNEKDMMRAEFAMTARRLETSIEELKNKTSAHLGDLAKKSNVIAKLKEALDEREKAIASLEANNDKLEGRTKALFDDLQIAKADVSLKTDEVTQAERALARAKSDVTDLRLAFEEREHVLERQSAEISTMRNHVEMVRTRVAEFANEMRQSEDRLAHDRVDLLRVPSPSLSAAAPDIMRSDINGAHVKSNGSNGLNGSNVMNGGNGYSHVNGGSIHHALNGTAAE
jgi:predicted  nucleic acid-binding Zn-ribbon protein